MYWLEVSVVTDGEAAEAVAEALRPFAHNDGVVLEQLGDGADLAPDALEPAVTVKIYVPEGEDSIALRRRIEEILYHMNRLYPVPPPTFRKLEDEDWADAWKAHYHPFRVGKRIWIQPTWIDRPEDDETGDTVGPHDVVLRLDPGMAFGTGLHPTTQICLRALEELVSPGTRMLDVGTGSGILAIAAVKLGAAWVLGVDTDEMAVRTAAANASNNGVQERFQVALGSLAAVTNVEWDLVVVNILASAIIDLLQREKLMAYVAQGGRLLLSGIIDQQAGDVETAVAQTGGHIVRTFTVRDWVGYVVVGPGQTGK